MTRSSLLTSVIRRLPLIGLLVFWGAILTYRPTVYTVLGGASISATMGACLFWASGRLKFAVWTTTLCVALLWVLSSIKNAFWKARLVFSDLTLITDPGNFETAVHYPLPALVACLAMVGVLGLCIKTFKAPQSIFAFKKRTLFAFPVVAIGLGLSLLAVDKGQAAWLVSLPKGSNVVANLLMSAHVKYESPAARMVASDVFPDHPAPTVQPKTPLPDLVFLLQESTMNPRYLKGLETAGLGDLSMFESPYATIQGPLRVHTYGGATWRSEFSFLTGLSSEDFAPLSNSVFYSAVFHVQDSLFRRLKAAGYKIVVINPFTEGSFNTGKAHRALGADEILHPADLGYPAKRHKNLWHIKTAEILDLVKLALDKYESPVAIYALTMQEHGPYPAKDVQSTELKTKTGIQVSQERLLSLENYQRRIREISPVVTAFDRWVVERKKPTILLRFGDHQPDLKWKPGYQIELPHPDYLTQFALIDNRSSSRETLALTDIVFLPGMILERLPIDKGLFYDTNIAMRHLCQGRYLDCPNPSLLRAYQNEIFVKQRIAE